MRASIRFIKKFHFLWSIPLSVMLFIGVQRLLWWYDDTSAPMDIGILHRVTLAIVHLLCYVATAISVIGFNFPTLFSYYYKQTGEDFNRIEPWQRLKLFFLCFFALILCLVLLTPTGSVHAYRQATEQK